MERGEALIPPLCEEDSRDCGGGSDVQREMDACAKSATISHEEVQPTVEERQQHDADKVIMPYTSVDRE